MVPRKGLYNSCEKIFLRFWETPSTEYPPWKIQLHVLRKNKPFVHHFSHFLTTTLLISSYSSSQTRRLKTLYLPLESRETRIISREGIRVFFFFFWKECPLPVNAPSSRKNFTREVEARSKNPHGWIAFWGRKGDENDWWEGEGERACLKVHSWYWNPAWKANRLLSSPSTHCPSSPSSASLLQFAPSTICFVEKLSWIHPIGSLSLCSTNNRLLIRRSSLAKAFVEISEFPWSRYRFNRYRYRPPPPTPISKTFGKRAWK